jgi:hypothetical protein
MLLSVGHSANCSNTKLTLNYAEKQKTERKQLPRLKNYALT